MGDEPVFDINGVSRQQHLWPKHCTQGSWGSELHPDLKVTSYFAFSLVLGEVAVCMLAFLLFFFFVKI